MYVCGTGVHCWGKGAGYHSDITGDTHEEKFPGSGKSVFLKYHSASGRLFQFYRNFAALPKMMGGELTGVDSSVYVPMDYAMLLLIILSTVMVLVSMIALVSAFAKSVKEAATTVSPFTIVVTFIGLSPMLSQGKEIPLYRYLIPVYNSVQCMNGIFSFSYQPAEILLTVIVNLCVAGVLVFGLTRAFQSEKIIYS